MLMVQRLDVGWLAAREALRLSAPAGSLLGFCVRESRCHVRLQPFLGAWHSGFHRTFCTVNVVSQHMKSCAMALGFDDHHFSSSECAEYLTRLFHWPERHEQAFSGCRLELPNRVAQIAA